MSQPSINPNLEQVVAVANHLLPQVIANAPVAATGVCEVEFLDGAEPQMPEGADDCVEFLDGEYVIVPIMGERQSIGRTVPVLRWRFSGPHVYGGQCPRSGEPLEGPEPEEADFDSAFDALKHFAKVYATEQMYRFQFDAMMWA